MEVERIRNKPKQIEITIARHHPYARYKWPLLLILFLIWKFIDNNNNDHTRSQLYARSQFILYTPIISYWMTHILEIKHAIFHRHYCNQIGPTTQNSHCTHTHTHRHMLLYNIIIYHIRMAKSQYTLCMCLRPKSVQNELWQNVKRSVQMNDILHQFWYTLQMSLCWILFLSRPTRGRPWIGRLEQKPIWL